MRKGRSKMKQCPSCDSNDITISLTKNRWNVYQCKCCFWESCPFEPETKEVSSLIEIAHFNNSGWNYKIFDRYGRIHTVSASFGQNNKQALEELKKELNNLNKAREENIGGPFKGVLYFVPSHFTIQGSIVL